MKTNFRILAIVIFSTGFAACAPNTGFRGDGILHYPAGEQTGIPGGSYSPATDADNMDGEEGADEVQGGINVGTGAGTEGDTLDIVPLEFPISGVGHYLVDQGPYINVQANKILKIKFASQPQEGTVEGTGFAPTYSGLGVYIQVGTLSYATPLLSTGVISPPQISQVMNFSSKIPQTCGSDTSCRATVKIRVNRPNYDFYCLNFPGGWFTGDSWYYPCNYPGYNKVHESHPWNGILYVYTDDTGSPN